jgi:biopolymer transport protein ExbB
MSNETLSTATAAATPVVHSADPFTYIYGFFHDGGNFMYLILLVAAIGVAITIERTIFLQLTKMKNQAVWTQLFPLISQGKFKQALETAKGSSSAIARILVYGLSRSAYAANGDEIEMAMEEGLMEAIPQLERRTQYVAAFANIANLLGLLGTILGLIDAFHAVAAADPVQKADLLSASISVAMNNTAFGLIVAIPLLLAFTYLQAKTAQLVDSMEMASVKFLNVIRQAQAQIKKSGDA